jgi:hypothetical protein
MKKEYQDLLNKYTLLNSRLHEGKENLSYEYKALLVKQRTIMEQYLRILEERAFFEKIDLLGK